MAVLVTGGAGFIGSHVAEALLARGESVVVVDNLNSFYDPQLKRQNLEAIDHPQLKVIIGDLADGDIRAQGLEGVDRVIHLAASAGVRPSIEDPAKYVHQNLMIPTLLLESMRTAGISKLVWASSSSVYGDHLETPFAESASVMKPVSPYAATKVGGEALAACYNHLYGMDITSLRFFTVYGERQRPEMAIHKFARLMMQDRPIPQFGDGSTARDYTYIGDIVPGVLAALDRLGGCHVYNLGEAEMVRLDRLIAAIGQAIGKTPVVEVMPLQPGDVTRTNAAIQRAQTDLDYQPTTSIEGGLARFADWFLARPWLWQDT
ncbi:MAG: epimerase [Myxococcales bacterium]|nr:epimerase [Myxococcales bacterium]|tara:strand:- start:138 stop:1094 length:957 start_codon:yes stop_codon:yes gene_type:complete